MLIVFQIKNNISQISMTKKNFLSKEIKKILN